MKCEKCGFEPFEGDQVCINCGAKLSINVVNNNDIKDNKVIIEENNKNKRAIYITIGAIIVLIIVVFLVINFLIIKR